FKNKPTSVYNGIFAVREGDGYSLYYANEKPKLVPGCENLLSTGLFFADEYAPVVHKGKRITVINRDGDEMYTLAPQKGKEIIFSNSFFTDGMLVVINEDKKYGAFNHDGELTVACKYDDLTPFNGGYAVAMTKDSDKDVKKYQIIDHDGNTVQSIKTCQFLCSLVIDGKCAIKIDDDRYGFVTVDGDVIKCPTKVKGIGDFNGKYFTYFDDDFNEGLMEFNDDGGEMLIKAGKYKSLAPINKSWSKFIARIDDEYRLIDRDDETLIKFEDYKSVSVLSQSAETLLAKEGNYYTVLDDDGEVIDKKLEIEEISYGNVRSVLSDFPKARDAVKTHFPYETYSQDADMASEADQVVATTIDDNAEVEEWTTTDDYNYSYGDSTATVVESVYDYYDVPAEAVEEAVENYYNYPAAE
ncbi:MAG: WG repeat-containing protein, partial [Muribaculaceae bacterium]|nr:WG repeat-containing protein [Muribaculaceae bacterium]